MVPYDRRFRRGALALIALIAVGAGGLLLGLRLGPASSTAALPRPALTTLAPVAVDPLGAWAIRIKGIHVERVSTGEGYLFPVADPAALVQPSKPLGDNHVLNQWVQANQGADARSTTVRLSITGSGVVLTALRVVDVRCAQPTASLRVDLPAGKARTDQNLVRVRLDPARTRITRDFRLPLTVGKGAVVVVRAEVAQRACEWRLLLQYTAGDRPGFVEIANGAQPFRTAPGPADGRPAWTTTDGVAFTRALTRAGEATAR